VPIRARVPDLRTLAGSKRDPTFEQAYLGLVEIADLLIVTIRGNYGYVKELR
jgi:hypothetical protein